MKKKKILINLLMVAIIIIVALVFIFYWNSNTTSNSGLNSGDAAPALSTGGISENLGGTPIQNNILPN
jgi:flagellar basal body-associated protein FliL